MDSIVADHFPVTPPVKICRRPRGCAGCGMAGEPLYRFKRKRGSGYELKHPWCRNK